MFCLQSFLGDGLGPHVAAEYPTDHVIVTQRLVQPETRTDQLKKQETRHVLTHFDSSTHTAVSSAGGGLTPPRALFAGGGLEPALALTSSCFSKSMIPEDRYVHTYKHNAQCVTESPHVCNVRTNGLLLAQQRCPGNSSCLQFQLLLTVADTLRTHTQTHMYARAHTHTHTRTCKLAIKGGWKVVDVSFMMRFMARLMADLVASESASERVWSTCLKMAPYRRVNSIRAKVLSRWVRRNTLSTHSGLPLTRPSPLGPAKVS